jgi:hypothetical protein
MPAIDNQVFDTSDLDAFTNTLRTLAPADIRDRARHLQAAADDLDWWQTTITVDRRLRDAHLSRQASAAACAARDAVIATARSADGLDDEAAAVARAAGDAARALVAGCRLSDVRSFAVSCEPADSPNPMRAAHPTAA